MARYIFVLLTTVSFLWGTSFAAAKICLTELDPMTLVVLRFTIAAIIFALILWRLGGQARIASADIPAFLGLGFFGITSYFYIQFTGLMYTTSIHAALLLAASPIMVAVLGAVLRVETLTVPAAGCIAVSFVGVALVITQGQPLSALRGGEAQGDLLLLSNAVVWAGLMIYGKRILQKYRPLVAMAYMHISGALLLLPMALLPGVFSPEMGRQIAGASWPVVVAALYLAVFCSVYAYYIWYAGVDIIGAVRTSVFSYLNPVFAMLAGVLFLGEQASWATVGGGVLVIAGVYGANKCQTAAPPAERRVSRHDGGRASAGQ